MSARNSRVIGVIASLTVALSGLWVAAPPAAQAAGRTFVVTSDTLCGGAGTFEQALKAANGNPGRDTIEFAAGLGTVKVATDSPATSCYRPGMPFPFAGTATESVDIVGNGVLLEGRQEFRLWLDTNPTDRCPRDYSQAQWVRHSTGFLQVGAYNADNRDVAASVSDMRFHNLPSLVRVERNASFSMTGTVADEINDFNDRCDEPAVATDEKGANISLSGVWITNSHTPGASRGEVTGGALVYGGSPSGRSRGNLALDRVYFAGNEQGRAVNWFGGSTTIVTSQFVDSGGMILEADDTQIVNSAFWSTSLHRYHVRAQGQENRILSSNGQIAIKASTFYWTDPTCEYCSTSGMGFYALGPARFDLSTSAIGANASLPGRGPLLFGNTAAFASDGLTWVQPTPGQDAAALRAMLPQVMVDPPGLKPDAWNSTAYLAAVTPLLGTPAAPGVLIDAVPDANGGNRLINPIDGSTITTDALGNPRVDANGRRNIGAVQLTYAPGLTVGDPTKTSLTARWTRPLDPPSGSITGYRLSYRVKGSGAPFTQVAVTGEASVVKQIDGLTPDTDYEFTVVAVNASGDGPPSETVIGRTLPDPHLDYSNGKGTVGTRFDVLEPHTHDVSAPRTYTAFDGALPPGLRLNRTSGKITGTPTKAGKYEFKVAVTGGNNSRATTTVTITISDRPDPVAPVLSYPAGQGEQGTRLVPLDPSVSGLSGSLRFSVVKGRLPDGVVLDETSGEIAGTPKEHGVFSVKVRVTGKEGSADTTTRLDIRPSATPYLYYSAIEGTAGKRVDDADPHPGGLTGTLTYALTSGVLPAGLRLDALTGVISGTPQVAGEYRVTVTATGSNGSAAAQVRLTISDKPAPQPEVTAIDEHKALPVARPTEVVSKVKGAGRVEVRTYCRVNGVRVGKYCDTTVSAGNTVTVTPRCSDRVTFTVRIIVKAEGEPTQRWTRTWRVARQPIVSCRTGGTG